MNNALLTWASSDLNRRYLPQLAEQKVGAYAFSEAGSGSDAFAMATTATKRANQLDFRLAKTFTVGPAGLTAIVQCFNCAHSSNRTTSNMTYYVVSGGEITSLNGNFGVPNIAGSPRQFQLGARLAF